MRVTNLFAAHCQPADVPFSWSRAAAHYDKTRFVLPVPLDRFDSLTSPNAISSCAEFFMALEGADTFVFTAGGALDGNEADGVGVEGEGGASGEDGAAPKNQGKAKGDGLELGDGWDFDGDGLDVEEGLTSGEDEAVSKNKGKATVNAKGDGFDLDGERMNAEEGGTSGENKGPSQNQRKAKKNQRKPKKQGMAKVCVHSHRYLH